MVDTAADWLASTDPSALDAVHIEPVLDPFGGQRTVGMVRHAGHPYRVDVPSLESDAAWFALAAGYLKTLRRTLDGRVAGLSLAWPDTQLWRLLEDGAPATDAGGFGWLPITWGRRLRQPDAEPGTLPDTEPIGSFWVPRRADAVDSRDGSLVLLAGRVAYGRRDGDGGPRHALLLSGDTGLRLTLHVTGEKVHILGVTLSGLATDRARAPLPWPAAANADPLFDLVKRLRDPIDEALGGGRTPWLRVLEAVPGVSHRLRAAGHALRSRLLLADELATAADRKASRAGVFDFSVEVDVANLRDPRVVRVLRNEFAGSAAASPPLRRRPAAATGDGDGDGVGVGDTPAPPLPRGPTYVPVRLFLQDGASAPQDRQRAAADAVRCVTDPGASAAPVDPLVAVRPTRPDTVLDRLRSEVDVLLDGQRRLFFAAGVDADAPRLFETRAGRRAGPRGVDAAGIPVDRGAVVRARRQPGKAADASPSTDLHAALEAHCRAAELFVRLAAYGISAEGHFRFAALPLVQRARGATRWAPEADLPYAEVRPFLGDDKVRDAADLSPMARPQLLVKYGSADPSHRRMVEVDPPDARKQRRLLAQYLGVASDPRWAWHEFGHVLNYAATGELEFPFAHSAGDALAAIVADPLSSLAADNEAPLRFVSFPWIEVPGRSHGRSAAEGYCWCGRRNLVRLASDAPLARHHHGYFEEQILSASLFRLYRCLGGDTRGGEGGHADADAGMRLEASDFTVHLILRAISLLGHDGVAPARTADQFVSALIDADAGLGDWRVTADWPLDQDPRRLHRQGGEAHKVIRWAFEQQGLDATDDPAATVDGPGRAPLVDLYIADRRRAGAADGGYTPVPLRWHAQDQPWHAAADAVRVDGRAVHVQVRDRGRASRDGRPAVQVVLRAWWARAPAAGQPLRWTSLDSRHADGQPDAQLPLRHGAGWLLVAADTPADRSNLADGKPPPGDPLALMHLVAQDNNLALRWLDA